MLTLYTYFRSSAAFRVRIALAVKGLAWTPQVVWLLTKEHQSPEYRALNPQGLVPSLVEDGHTLTQSLSIIEYLDETQPGPKLLPADALGRARVRAISQSIACEIHPLNNPRVLEYLKTTLGHDQTEVDTWYRHWCEQGFAALEGLLADPRTGTYCHGDAVTMADCCLVPQVFNARRFKVDMTPFVRTSAIFDRLMQLPAFEGAQPSRQPEAQRAV
jgi:maleylacetoacetate isomerase